MTKQALIVGLGEILWDVLPSGTTLGGAPTNFAYMTDVLGDIGIVSSRVGNDKLGREARASLETLGLSSVYLQCDETLETGTTAVSIDHEGQPTFSVRGPVAWDNLQWTPEWRELANRADVVCFGSLAQRSAQSANTIEHFIQSVHANCLRVFDVNLRESFYSRDLLFRSLHHADIVKLNEYELRTVASLFEIQGYRETVAKQLLQTFELELLCVTKGSRGSVLISWDEVVEHPGIQIDVVDAIGAGDAFTACLVHYYIRDRSLTEISEAANHFASHVATRVGATPVMDKSQMWALVNEEK